MASGGSGKRAEVQTDSYVLRSKRVSSREGGVKRRNHGEEETIQGFH